MMPPLLPEHWIAPGYWFTGDPTPPTPYFAVVTLFFVVALFALIAVYVLRRRVFASDPVLIGLAARLTPWAITIAAIGVFLIAWRYAEAPYFSARFLWLACALGLVAMAGYVVRFMRRDYPRRAAELRARQERERYTPRPGGRRRRR